jgi:hypothetical protein
MDDYILDKIRKKDERSLLTKGKEQVDFFLKFKGKKYPITYFDNQHLEIETSVAPKLRGLVDIYRSNKYFAQCLLVVSNSGEFRTRYEYKRYTKGSKTAPTDYIEG